MEKRKTINPKARGTYYICLIIAEIIGFNVINTGGDIFGAFLVGAGAALVAYLVAQLITGSQS